MVQLLSRVNCRAESKFLTTEGATRTLLSEKLDVLVWRMEGPLDVMGILVPLPTVMY